MVAARASSTSQSPSTQHHQHRSPSSRLPTGSHVRVVGRIRPLAAYESANGSTPVVKMMASTDSSSPSNHDIIYVEPTEGNGAGSETRWFQLDAVLDGESSQREVYERSGAHHAVTQDIFQGFNCTILAYGQTGAGKTFTMGSAAPAPADAQVCHDNETDLPSSATPAKVSVHCGIIPRACADLFDAIHTRCRGQASVELSYLEVYNEEIRDLLNPNSNPQQLRIREQLNGEVYVRGLESRPVKSPADIGRLMQEASERRVTASTNMNAVSSRSHAICVLRIQGTVQPDENGLAESEQPIVAGNKIQAKLTLVDLAGSERIKKTGAQGERAQEGISINKGLFVLGQVVSALSEQRPTMKRKPPYRDSKLTRLLQDSLGGNSRTIMIACVSPADFNLEESVNTLRYATSARNIKNTATRNVTQTLSTEAVAKLVRENELLKQEVRELQQTIERMAVESAAREEAPVEDKPPESFSLPHEDGSESTQRILQLEHEVQILNQALEKAREDLRVSTASNAVEIPALEVKVALLENELNSNRQIQKEAEHLRLDLEELRTEADVAKTAAKRLSHIVQDMSQRSVSTFEDGIYVLGNESSSSIQSDMLDEKGIRRDFEIVKANEAWLNFVVVLYSLFKEDMRVLGDRFNEVTKMAHDAVSSDNATSNRRHWWGSKKEEREEKGKSKEEQMATRVKMLDEQISSYNQQFLDIEDRLENRFESLVSVEDSVQKEREQLEKKLSHIDIRDVEKNSKVLVLLKWLRVTLGITTSTDMVEDDSVTSSSEDRSTTEPFSLFDQSTQSMTFDDSESGFFGTQGPAGILGSMDEDSDGASDDDLLF